MPSFTKDDINNRFDYHKPTEAKGELHQAARSKAKTFATWMNKNLPESREASLAVTNLEQALFWANAAIAREHG